MSIILVVNFTEKIIHYLIGFPLGLNISEVINDFSHLQLTPLLQVGNISAILPFSGLPKPNSFVLDIVVNPGSSGSPLFLEDGRVVGIVYATRKDFAPLMEINDKQEIELTDRYGVYIPAGLGFAIPSSRFPTEWLLK